MVKSNNNAVRVVRIKKTDDLKAIYAKIKKSFTAADLQRYTVDEKGISEEEMLARLKAADKDELRKMQRRKNKS